MSEIPEIYVGKSVCFVTKDEKDVFRTITIQIMNDEHMEVVDNMFNNKYTIKSFVSDKSDEALRLGQRYIREITGKEKEKHEIDGVQRKSHDSNPFPNPPGHNSYYKHVLDDGSEWIHETRPGRK